MSSNTRTIDNTNAACMVLTHKEGGLSAIAHDLAIEVTSFSIVVDGDGHVRGEFNANSLSILGAVNRAGNIDQSALSSKARNTILKNIRDDVLKSLSHKSIELEGHFNKDTLTFEGALTMCKQKRPLKSVGVIDKGTASFEVLIDQRAFGIKPYSAMMGLLKVKSHVKVCFSYALES